MENEEKQTGLEKFLGVAQASHVDVAKRIMHEVEEGNVNPIEILLALKRMHKVLELTISSEKGNKELKESFKTAVANALDKASSVTMFGATLSIRPTGIKYLYEDCKDSYLNAWYEIAETAKANIKQREAEIKAMLPPDNNKDLGIRSRTLIQSNLPYIAFSDDEFEEKVYPPIKKAGESIFVTFKH